MLTIIEQFAGKDIWVYAELEYEDAYIRVEKVFDNGTVWYNAWLPSDSYDKYDLDEILYGELTGDVDSIEIHPLDTLTTEELIAKIKADGKISGCSKVTSSRKFTKYPQGYIKASSDNSDQDYETRLDDFMNALEHTPMIRRNTYATPIHIGIYDGTIQISSNIDMVNAIATVERLGAKYNVIEPNSAYAKDDYTLAFNLNRGSQQSPEYINRLG